jgi:hypothetical protein
MSLRPALGLLAFLAGLGLAGAAPAAPTSGAPVPEYEVKAAFLLNFARFVEWPARTGAEPFVVSVLGQDPFGPVLDRAFEGAGGDGRKWEVRRIARVEGAGGTQILFISRSEAPRLAAVLASLRGTPVLTVSDIPDFAQRGGMIGLRLEDRRVRFDIDPAPASASGLRLSSQLLKLARIVSAKEPQ